jgi:hypothetical protein
VEFSVAHHLGLCLSFSSLPELLSFIIAPVFTGLIIFRLPILEVFFAARFPIGTIQSAKCLWRLGDCLWKNL